MTYPDASPNTIANYTGQIRNFINTINLGNLVVVPLKASRSFRVGRVDVSYQAMALADLSRLVAAEADFDSQWRLVVESLKEYHQEPTGVRLRLLEETPEVVSHERWDVLFIELAEHLAMRDGQPAPGWSAPAG